MADLVEMQKKALKFADREGLMTKSLGEKELKKFDLAFNRSFALQYPDREIRNSFERHKAAILLGAAVAKEQMDATIDGEQPQPGKIGGPVPIRAAYLGIGDDWEDSYDSDVDGPLTTGAAQNWIHSGTTLLGGTNGNAVRIGENAVHVVIGIRSRHPSPKIESVKFTVDGNEKPVINTGFAQKASAAGGLRWKEFDNPQVWDEDKTILGTAFATTAYGATTTDYPELVGASFIKEDQLRTQDPSNLTGTTADVILTT